MSIEFIQHEIDEINNKLKKRNDSPENSTTEELPSKDSTLLKKFQGKI